ncbi:MAG: L-histidine N(alpha)-methyltransferase [Lysobacterales bacterium]
MTDIHPKDTGVGGLGYDPQFAADVAAGLGAENKRLHSRYFYDADGDRLFQAIMASPEYYLTDCEYEIFSRQGDRIAQSLAAAGALELDELGSGDGHKTRLLLDALHRIEAEFTYRPIDISANSLRLLSRRLKKTRPWLRMKPIHADYMELLNSRELAPSPPGGPHRVTMFLGSNLGNFTQAEALRFLRMVRASMCRKDAFLIGLDLQKDPAVIRAAYDDAAGHTRAFNLNLLSRINRELGGNFVLSNFRHVPEYDAASGAARSFLVSLKPQDVHIAAVGRDFHFREGERIFTEISQKYSREQIAGLAADAGFRVGHEYYDSRHYFTDQVWYPV